MSEVVELTLERIVPGGLALARTPDGVVLVRGGLPGERVRAQVQTRKGYRSGDVVAILDAHPQRADIGLPPGADLPVAYDEQLPIKTALVRDAIERVAKIEIELAEIAPSPDTLRYRTVSQYAALPHGGLAARERGVGRLIPLDDDPLAAPPVARVFDLLRAHPMPSIHEVVLRGSLHADACLVGLIAEPRGQVARIAQQLMTDGVAGVSWGEVRKRARFHGATRHIAGERGLLEDFGGLLTTVTVRSFAQVNPRAAGLLYREAAAIAGTGARAIDLYAGSGVLAMHLASGYEHVIGVEIANDGVRRGDADRARLGIENVRFHRGDARSVARYLPADLVAINPPRAGCAPEALDAIADAGPARVLYVSCDPATWARDVARLGARGYRVTFARPYDFYPYTHHVELLSLLER